MTLIVILAAAGVWFHLTPPPGKPAGDGGLQKEAAKRERRGRQAQTLIGIGRLFG
jgi:hypothetical protein